MTNSKQSTIMAVDDSKYNLEILKEYLLHSGYGVVTFTDGAQALENLDVHKPNLFLLDINMPEMDGYEICEQLKKTKNYANTPVIFLSALNGTADKVKAFACGGVDFIEKPFDFEDLMHRIENHLIISQQHKLLEEQNLLKDRFMKIAAHDLRNPLMGIMTNAELLELDFPEVTKDPDVAEIISEIRRSAQNMEDIINEFLDVQVISNATEFESCEFNPITIVHQVVSQNKSIAARKNITIDCTSSETRTLVKANPSRVHQVITNYVSNAVKYSPPGSAVKVKYYTKDEFRIEVQDQGPGIPEEERSLLFKQFRCLSTKPTGGEKSVGLGLWAVQNMAGAMGGRVGADFPSTGGSIFWFELPLCQLPVTG